MSKYVVCKKKLFINNKEINVGDKFILFRTIHWCSFSPMSKNKKVVCFFYKANKKTLKALSQNLATSEFVLDPNKINIDDYFINENIYRRQKIINEICKNQL